MRHSRRNVRGSHINSLAVARFLVERGVWGSEASETQAKDTVNRALSPDRERQLLTPETLSRFIDGFGFAATESAGLWASLSGEDEQQTQPVSGALMQVPNRPVVRPGFPPRQHATVSLHELHYIGPLGLPDRHRTVQVIRSLVDGLTSYPYRIDTDAADVQVVRGGHVGASYWADGVLYAFEIVLVRPLRMNETASIEYETTFSYAEPPPPEFRRAALARVDNLELYLQFHPHKLPERVWWARWDDYRPGAQTVEQERIRLDTERSAHRFLPYVERTVVGFHWLWAS
jgi:hypothetical protein